MKGMGSGRCRLDIVRHSGCQVLRSPTRSDGCLITDVYIGYLALLFGDDTWQCPNFSEAALAVFQPEISLVEPRDDVDATG